MSPHSRDKSPIRATERGRGEHRLNHRSTVKSVISEDLRWVSCCSPPETWLQDKTLVWSHCLGVWLHCKPPPVCMCVCVCMWEPSLYGGEGGGVFRLCGFWPSLFPSASWPAPPRAETGVFWRGLRSVGPVPGWLMWGWSFQQRALCV